MVWVRGAGRHLCEGEGQHESVSLHQTERKCSQNVLKWNSSDFPVTFRGLSILPHNVFEASLRKKAFWRSQKRSTKNEAMVLVNKDLTKRGFQKFSPELERNIMIMLREREHFKYISSITSKFKLCFVIDVVTISYSLYWHRIVFWEKKSITLIAFICDGDIDIYVVEIKNANIVLL